MSRTPASMPGRRSGRRAHLCAAGRQAARRSAWAEVETCARELLADSPADAEGHFLLGLAAAGRRRPAAAIGAFERALQLDFCRYDAAVELAAVLQRTGRHGDAVALLRAREQALSNSPHYLDMAATVFRDAGLPDEAYRLYARADGLQPGVDALRARLAAAAVHVGRIDEARRIYTELLARHPMHQRNHYELSRLATARDRAHIEQMQAVLDAKRLPDAQNIYLYYALGKEHEDLGEWDAAFGYYRRAGDAAAEVSGYDVTGDLELVDALITACDADWLANDVAPVRRDARPVFVVGLPRSGTTLVDRILASHSQVSSAGETFFVPAALRALAGEAGAGVLDARHVPAAAGSPAAALAERYLDAVAYRRGSEPIFVDKLPENFLYLGFLARAFPAARFVHVRRNPMDACFAMYKQSFFRYAYTLADLGRYYPAWHRLAAHWDRLLGERLVTVRYEALVADPAAGVRRLLERLGLPFEPACLAFHEHAGATNTASAVQVREGFHTRSVGRWRRFAAHLEPLARDLRAAGIDVEDGQAVVFLTDSPPEVS